MGGWWRCDPAWWYDQEATDLVYSVCRTSSRGKEGWKVASGHQGASSIVDGAHWEMSDSGIRRCRVWRIQQGKVKAKLERVGNRDRDR